MQCQELVCASNTSKRLHEWSGKWSFTGNKWKEFFSRKKKALESLEKGLRDNSKYTPRRFFRHSIYSKKG